MYVHSSKKERAFVLAHNANRLFWALDRKIMVEGTVKPFFVLFVCVSASSAPKASVSYRLPI